ncbi:MAG: hypothetical protein H6709_19545 [Kofleriaceae bacterium]|nr:hypothetical protein [Kofleriaceae bacterium]
MFDERGRANELLQAYFEGLSTETLRPLLRSQDLWGLRSASFIAAELGPRSQPLLEDVIPLLASDDRHVQNYAMEVLTSCCTGAHAECFAHVVRKLASADEGIRKQALDQVARASRAQLEGALNVLERLPGPPAHTHGLRVLLATDGRAVNVARAMSGDVDPLVRAYADVVLKRSQRRARSRSPLERMCPS